MDQIKAKASTSAWIKKAVTSVSLPGIHLAKSSSSDPLCLSESLSKARGWSTKSSYTMDYVQEMKIKMHESSVSV